MIKSTYHYFFRNLANPVKIKIITMLKEKDASVNEVAEELEMEQSKVSHALASLRCCNIVNIKQKGKQRVYSLNKTTVLPMLKLIDKHEKTFCKKCRMAQ